MENKQIVSIVGLAVVGSVLTVMGVMTVRDALARRRAIMIFAIMRGVSYKEAKRILKAYQKAPSPQAAVDLFGDMARDMFANL